MSTVIKVENLCKDYKTPNGVLHALVDVNLNVEKGDIYGVIGLSGAGKSTLIRCLNLLEPVTSGSVYFNDVDLTKIKKKELLLQRRKIGMIFQSFNLLDQRNVFKNIAYPLELAKKSKQEIEETVTRLLNLVGLSDKAKSYPSQLSGGQQQRVAIARALANDPEVLLCDEPTSALDPNTTDQILQLIKKVNEELGVTVIIITHEMRVIEKICNKVSIISQSRIVEDGNVTDIFSNPKSDIARQLILPTEMKDLVCNEGKAILRVVYDGNVNEPVLSNTILKFQCPISILASTAREIEGKVYGQLVIEVPSELKNDILGYIRSLKLTVEEEMCNG